MNRILTFHSPDQQTVGRFGAAYYLDTAYHPVAVRIQAGTSPHVDDATFEILKDGVSIMNNRDYMKWDVYGKVSSNDTSTTVVLTKGESSADFADDFIGLSLDDDCWITCELEANGGGKNFTVQLELQQVTED